MVSRTRRDKARSYNTFRSVQGTLQRSPTGLDSQSPRGQNVGVEHQRHRIYSGMRKSRSNTNWSRWQASIQDDGLLGSLASSRAISSVVKTMMIPPAKVNYRWVRQKEVSDESRIDQPCVLTRPDGVGGAVGNPRTKHTIPSVNPVPMSSKSAHSQPLKLFAKTRLLALPATPGHLCGSRTIFDWAAPLVPSPVSGHWRSPCKVHH